MKDMIKAQQSSVLCWLATLDREGYPSVSPKEIFTIVDDQLLIADIHSLGSVKNIEAHPFVAVSFINVYAQKGYKVKGMARVYSVHDQEYRRLVMPLEEMTQGKYEIRSIISVAIEKVSKIIAPSYIVYPNEALSDKIRIAQELYLSKLNHYIKNDNEY